jgi:hypothetical protein
MPALKIARHEMFVMNLVQGMTQIDAYKAAGYRRNQPAANRLARLPEIAIRRAELLADVTAKTCTTAEQLILKAEAAYEVAMATGKISAAVAAIREIGILTGVRVEKRASTIRAASVNELSDEELMAIACGEPVI